MDEPGLFRLFSPQSPTTRQTTRTLQELNDRRLSGMFNLREIGHNLVNDQVNVPVQTGGNNTPLVSRDNTMSGSERLLAAHTPSPDEAVIQARGRRQVPLTFSPDITPLRQQMQRTKLSLAQVGNSRLSLPNMNIKLSPRKRLTLTDTPPSPQMYVLPPDMVEVSPLAKRLKLDEDTKDAVDPVVAARGLGQAQLVQLIDDIVKTHPEIRADVISLLPSPDLSVMEQALSQHKKNIYKSLPNTRLESKTDSMAYNRVSTHLASFRRVVNEGVKCLQSGEQWSAVVDYTILAWGYVQGTPVWDNPAHNSTRKACFKILASAALNALKAGRFAPDNLKEIRQKFKKISPAASELDVCIKYIDKSTKD